MFKPISIVICTYNGSAYLKEVIESILCQDGINDIVEKLLIVDNASKDNTKEIVLRLIENNPIIEYVFEVTPGLSNARKHGAYVNSIWVAYIDDDNILMQGWLKEAKKYIDENPNVGVINGASIPELRHDATENEIHMLKAIFPYLACTHFDMDQYKDNGKQALKAPFGAGMILRTKQLKEFLDAGWTHNEGRKGNNLGSGEDGEIAASVLDKGFVYGFNDKMVLRHIIPEFRLKDDYVDKLLKGLDKGFYDFISYKNNYVYYRLRTFLKSLFLIPTILMKILFTKDPVHKLKLKHRLFSRIRLSSFILRHLFLFRK